MSGLKKEQDDFNWEIYTTLYYEREMVEGLQRRDSLDMLVKSSYVDRALEPKVVYSDNLHSNWKELYNQICTLGVSSVFECGTGCAHHLINICKLCPEIMINGCDYSQSQIDLGYKYFSLIEYSFAKRLKIVDMTTQEATKGLPTSEFVYTQAVTMHLSWDRAKKFLTNMGKLSSKYVYLIENIYAHDYSALLKEALPEFEIASANSDYIIGAILLKRKRCRLK